MNSDINYINASCVIRSNIVYKNGKKIFESSEMRVADFLLSLYSHFNINYPKFYKMDDLCKLGLIASEILLKYEFKSENYLPYETIVVLANANSSLDTDVKYFNTLKDIPSPSLFVYTLPNIMTGEICIRNNFKGGNTFFILDDFDTVFFEHYINDLMNDKTVKVCICGWVDLLENEYKAVLFLIEKEKKETSILFSAGNMHKIFKL